MNWYGQLYEQNMKQSPLELQYTSMCRKIRLMTMRLQIAAQDTKVPRDQVSNLYWELETLKGKREEMARQLRAKPISPQTRAVA